MDRASRAGFPAISGFWAQKNVQEGGEIPSTDWFQWHCLLQRNELVEVQGLNRTEDESAGREARAPATDAARKRAAIELIARHERSLRRTARRYSLCGDDADDAFQRGLEILLTKAPTDDLRELIRWTHTVIKHEALTVRRNRERLLGPAAVVDEAGEAPDWTALIPAQGDGPPEQAERREEIARSREALQALKPQELRALTLLAEGYSYVEIGKITGFSQTKVNRCLAEGRERFRSLISRSEDGSRCKEMKPLLSAFCDEETSPREAAELREHLRACAHCRATLRAYRAAPRAAAALVPVLPASQSLLERAKEAVAGLSSRLPGRGGGGDTLISQVAATGGARGAGMTALAKLLAVCAGTAGGAAACVATGVVPAPAVLAESEERPAIEQPAERFEPAPEGEGPAIEYEPAPEPSPTPPPKPKETPPAPAPEPPPSETGAIEYSAETAPPTSESATSSASGAGAAGEFGP
jgi:RNA polymerase sigma factor (sigma-70 family)